MSVLWDYFEISKIIKIHYGFNRLKSEKLIHFMIFKVEVLSVETTNKD